MIKLKKGQHAMLHPHELNSNEIDFIIRKMNAVKFINEQDKYYKKCYTKEDEKKYEYIRIDLKILQELKRKLDIWTT